ncbi:MAG TPA: hypothetical protein VJ810_42870 [Blastocatellia bacterium]|nr:hypothetical protein [Blastocatellia bacterium]
MPDIYVAPKGSPNGKGTLEHPLDLATVLAPRSPARPGATIWLRGGVYRGAFTSYLSGSAQSPITLRQYPGERATIDGAGTPGPPLTINGGYAIYHGFEVVNSSPDRVHERPTGVNVLGHHVKLINLVVRDNGIGIGFWAPAIDSEIYGCVIHRNGWQGPAPDRGHGHGVYGQNAEGMKRIVNNIIFDQYGYGIHNYTQAGELKGFHIEGNIIFDNGSTSTPNDAGFPNILVGGFSPAERITITNNYTYYPDSIYATNVWLNYSAKNNQDVTLDGNYIAGGNSPLMMSEWLRAKCVNNTLTGFERLVGIIMPSGVSNSAYVWDNNTYYTNTSTSASPFALTSQGKLATYTFTDWSRHTGHDRNSRLIRTATGRPTGLKIAVLLNQYEAGRANIVVYNWDLKDRVEVDLSGALRNGDRFEIRNVRDLYGQPALSGVYSGAPLLLPMSGSQPAQEFGAFVLIKRGDRDN